MYPYYMGLAFKPTHSMSFRMSFRILFSGPRPRSLLEAGQTGTPDFVGETLSFRNVIPQTGCRQFCFGAWKSMRNDIR